MLYSLFFFYELQVNILHITVWMTMFRACGCYHILKQTIAAGKRGISLRVWKGLWTEETHNFAKVSDSLSRGMQMLCERISQYSHWMYKYHYAKIQSDS